MDTVIRNVDEIDSPDRQALEHVLGHPLREDQQVVIRVVSRQAPPPPREREGGAALPDWCNVYAGLSDAEIAELEKIILTRADLSRPSE
jgi:hypothetical protein